MILVYSEQHSNRLNYTLNVLFKYILKVDYSLVSYEIFCQATNAVKINYSRQNIPDCIAINPHTLLFEKEITTQSINVDWIENQPYFFKTASDTTFNYDLLAASFFMVSRYEEYDATDLDNHNRFKAENSIAFQHDFLQLPVVNLWALDIKEDISIQYPEFKFPTIKYDYINSIDIDIAYAYKGKNKLRLLSSTLKALLKLEWKELKTRYYYFTHKIKDPYDTYAFINKFQKEYTTKNMYFFLLGAYGKYDKNLASSSKVYKDLIQKIEQTNPIGIHPSYGSNTSKSQLNTEINLLKSIVNKKITHSRQHFLKLNVPNTYENLILNKIEYDYSMGFASQIGFRAGICSAYPFFNIEQNKEKKLFLIPFQIMDGTLNQYLKLNQEEAIEKISKIINVIKNVNGTFVSLWHNSSLGECNEWTNWTTVYKKLQQLAKTPPT